MIVQGNSIHAVESSGNNTKEFDTSIVLEKKEKGKATFIKKDTIKKVKSKYLTIGFLVYFSYVVE